MHSREIFVHAQGKNFVEGATVRLGSVVCDNITLISENEISAKVPSSTEFNRCVCLFALMKVRGYQSYL